MTLYKIIKTDKERYYQFDADNCLLTYIRFPGFRITFWFRIASRTKLFLSRKVIIFIYRRICLKHGIFMPVNTKIGKGLYLPHPCGVVINGLAEIGNFCSVHQGVTIGEHPFKKGEIPSIGNNVYLGPNCVLYGKIRVAEGCIVGANKVLGKSLSKDTKYV